MRAKQEYDMRTLSFRVGTRVDDYIIMLRCERELNDDELDLIGEVLTDTMNIEEQLRSAHELER